MKSRESLKTKALKPLTQPVDVPYTCTVLLAYPMLATSQNASYGLPKGTSTEKNTTEPSVLIVLMTTFEKKLERFKNRPGRGAPGRKRNTYVHPLHAPGLLTYTLCGREYKGYVQTVRAAEEVVTCKHCLPLLQRYRLEDLLESVKTYV